MHAKQVIVEYINESENLSKCDVEIDVENPMFLTIKLASNYNGDPRSQIIPWTAIKTVRITAVA